MGGRGGGALADSAPLLRLAPGGRLIVVTDEVEDMKVGSEISNLFTDLLRAEGMCTLAVEKAWEGSTAGEFMPGADGAMSCCGGEEVGERGVGGEGR